MCDRDRNISILRPGEGKGFKCVNESGQKEIMCEINAQKDKTGEKVEEVKILERCRKKEIEKEREFKHVSIY